MRERAQAPRFSRCRREAHGDEAGDTLIEILLTLVIMSITVVSLIAAFSSSIAASSEYRGLSVSDTLVRTVTEEVTAEFQQQLSAYISCPNATPGGYMSELGSVTIPSPYAAPTGAYSWSITSVTYWNGTSFGASCTKGSTVPEEMTITVSGPPGSKSESLAFVIEGDGQSGSAIGLHDPGLSVAPSTSVTSGGLDVTITAPDNVSTAPGFTQYYTVEACTDIQMTSGCSPPAAGFVAGLQTLSGLVPGTPYYVSVFANASPGYLASATVKTPDTTTSSGTSPYPVVVSVVPSTTTAGALTVSFTPGAAPNGDTFTATACTNTSMTANCVSQAVANQGGSDVTGLTQGTYYFVEVAAATDGTYTGGSSLAYTPAIGATIQLNPTSNVSVSPSMISSGALVVTFTAPSNAPSPQAYSVKACTNSAMSANCVSQGSYASGNQLTGLTAGTSYYVTVTALKSTVYSGSAPVLGYLASTSAVTATATEATVQLSAPSITSFGSPSGHKKIIVNFTGSANGPGGQTYTLTACTNALMTVGCVTNAAYTSGSTQGGLQQSTLYYVTITANASSGYLASSPSVQRTVTSS